MLKKNTKKLIGHRIMSKSNVLKDTNKKLVQGIQVLMMLVIFLTALLGYNMYKLHQYNAIESGTYYTETQCKQIFCPTFDFAEVQNETVIMVTNTSNG
jgi:hypothetical protein